MGLLANSVSLSVFQIEGALPSGEAAVLIGEQLARRGFRSIEKSAEEAAIGWVELDDFRAAGFADPAVYQRDSFIAFSLRHDRRRVPAALLRAYRREAEQAWLAENPSYSRVPKAKRDELHERVHDGLLARTLPVPQVTDAVWDTRSGRVLLASASPKIADQFEGLFRQTFTGLRLVAVAPLAWAEKLLVAEERERLASLDGAPGGSILERIGKNLWLGREFLAWLLERGLAGEGEFRLLRPGPLAEQAGFTAWPDERLVALAGEEGGTLTVTGSQGDYAAVRAALQAGRVLTEARIFCECAGERWAFTLKGERFVFGAFRAPAVTLEKDDLTDPAREREAVFFERMALLESGLQLFESLLLTFLRIRLAPGWPQEQARLSALL